MRRCLLVMIALPVMLVAGSLIISCTPRPGAFLPLDPATSLILESQDLSRRDLRRLAGEAGFRLHIADIPDAFERRELTLVEFGMDREDTLLVIASPVFAASLAGWLGELPSSAHILYLGESPVNDRRVISTQFIPDIDDAEFRADLLGMSTDPRIYFSRRFLDTIELSMQDLEDRFSSEIELIEIDGLDIPLIEEIRIRHGRGERAAVLLLEPELLIELLPETGRFEGLELIAPGLSPGGALVGSFPYSMTSIFAYLATADGSESLKSGLPLRVSVPYLTDSSVGK
jgi:hypothetical protein